MYRDEAALRRALASLPARDDVEIVVAATPDDRDTLEPIRRARPGVIWIEAPRGRARQMNAGAGAATAPWLLFLHADTTLAPGWTDAIAEAARRPDVAIGCFRFALDSPRFAARVIEAGVALRVRVFGLPYGDQALFVRRAVFDDLGGYADLPIMEDVDLVERARLRGHLYVSPLAATTSSRRWEQQGWVGRTLLHLGLILLYAAGVPPATLIRLDRARHV